MLATYTEIVLHADPEGNQFSARLDALNRLMKSKKLPIDVRYRLREYLYESRHLAVAAEHKATMLALSPALQGEITWRINHKWLTRVSILAGTSLPFQVSLTHALTPTVYAPVRAPRGPPATRAPATRRSSPRPARAPSAERACRCSQFEVVANNVLGIVDRGVALYGGRVLTSTSCWGEDVLISQAILRNKCVCRAMNYMQGFEIQRDTLIAVLGHYPQMAALLRRRTIMLAIRRWIILQAKRQLGLEDFVLLSDHRKGAGKKRKGIGMFGGMFRKSLQGSDFEQALGSGLLDKAPSNSMLSSASHALGSGMNEGLHTAQHGLQSARTGLSDVTTSALSVLRRGRKISRDSVGSHGTDVPSPKGSASTQPRKAPA